MSTPFPNAAPSHASLMREIHAALRREDFAKAETLIAAAIIAPEALIAAAELAMNECRWSQAAWFFDRVPQQVQGAAGIKRCLSRNLAALQKHRPELYAMFLGLPKNDNIGIGASATGHPTIVCRTAAGQNIALSVNNKPLVGLAAGLAHLKLVIEAGTSFALCGLGDGYLLHQVAHKPPKLYHDSEQSVFVLEPNAHIALTALMIHDYTGPLGPIEQARFQWFIGAGWEERFRRAIFGNLLLPCPHISVTQGLESVAIQNVLNRVVADLVANDDKNRDMVNQYYSTLDPAELSAVFGENPPRKPRALFLTTRFSTVLQFSTHDTSAAFREAGWETRTLIEPTPFHRIMTIATREQLAQFKPDVVFQIDHHRHEYPEIFPPNVPFVCWIQDHMTQLMKREAGEKLGPWDFVLTDAGPLYVHNYAYPQRQIIAMPKLTAAPRSLPRPSDWKRRAEDLVYVSNNARSPSAMLDALLAEAKDNQAEQALLTECWKRLIDLHAAGDCLPNFIDVCAFLRELADEMGIDLADARIVELGRTVNHPVCDALYRQQALGWIAGAADELGLRLGLYGNGWESHPTFSQYARGPVSHGLAQQELTRSAAINFQISPYLCLHQRLLEGICSGGFFLVREHMADTAPQEMLDLIETHCGPEVGRLDQARACVPPPVRDRFERLLRDCNRCLRYSGTEDPIEAVRAFQEAQLLQTGKGVLPHLDMIRFSDTASLKERIVRYAGDDELRHRLIEEQRESIVQRFTYASAMRRMTRRMGELLSTETPRTLINISTQIDIGRAA